MPRRKLLTYISSLSFPGSAGTAVNQVIVTSRPFAQTFTIAVWVKVAGSGQRTIVGATSNSGSTGAAGINFRVNGSNQLELLKQSTASLGVSVKPIPIGEWVHVAVKYSTPLATFYINGIPVNTVSSAQTFVTSAAQIGNRPPTTEPFNGLMTRYVEYTSALSDAEVYSLYATGVTTASPSLKLDFDDNTGTAPVDSSGNGHNGVITTATWSTDTPQLIRTTSPTRLPV